MLSKIFELSGPHELYLKDIDIDIAFLKENEIIAETIYSAISPGTEVAAYRGANPLRPGKVYPRVVGYCNVARVLKTGSNVTVYKEGDYILSLQAHQTIFKCSESDLLIKLDKDTDPKYAATTYLYHLGYHSLLSANAKAGHNIGVIGIGTLGYSVCMMGTLIGANTFAFTNQGKSREFLSKKNIHCFSKSHTALPDILSLTHETGLDIVINTSNTWDDWLFALQLVNKGGIIVNLGFPGRDEPIPPFNPLAPQYMYVKNISIKSLCYLSDGDVPHTDFRFSIKRNMLYILEMIKEKRLMPSDLISDEISYLDLKSQYEKYLDKSTTLFTTIINWK